MSFRQIDFLSNEETALRWETHLSKLPEWNEGGAGGMEWNGFLTRDGPRQTWTAHENTGSMEMKWADPCVLDSLPFFG